MSTKITDQEINKGAPDSIFKFIDNIEIEMMHDRILVEPILNSAKSESGLMIPESINKEKANQGKVLAFGSKKISDKLEKGVTVIYRERMIDNIKIKDKQFIIIKEDDVLAILK